jgi:hypothetical protein
MHLDGNEYEHPMSEPVRLDAAAKAVSEAFRKLADYPSEEAKAAYDLAYARWEELVEPIARSPGRPQSGDQPMTSSERARAARERQSQLARRWAKVAPLIQQLRKAVNSGDSASVQRISASLVKETAMMLTNFTVIHAQPDSYSVAVQAWDEHEMVLVFIPREALEDHFRRNGVKGKAANLVVDRNLEAFARIISAKYERGEYRPYARAGSMHRRIDITLEDIQTSGEELSDSVLDMQWSWQ